MVQTDRVKGVDGKGYVVATTPKSDTWETVVFQAGVLGAVMGKGRCFLEVVLGDRQTEALLLHTRTIGLVALLPRQQWEMSVIQMSQQQADAFEYLAAPEGIRPMLWAEPRNSPSLNAIRDHAAYGPGTAALLDWLDRMLALDTAQWQPVIQAASSDDKWADLGIFRIAASVVEGDPVLRAAITMAAGANGMGAVRAGAQNQQAAQYLMGIARNAEVALLTRHEIPDAVFRQLYAPFAEAIPLRGSSSRPVRKEASESTTTTRRTRSYRPPAGEREVTNDEVIDSLLEHLIPEPTARSLGVSRSTVEDRLKDPEFRVRYWPQEIARRVEVDYALRVLKVQPAENGLDLATIQRAFAEVHQVAVRSAADAYTTASNDGSSDEVGTTDSAQTAVEDLLVNHLKTLKDRDGGNWVLGPEDTEEEVRAFYDQLYRGTLE
jgi:hypothetical protein